MSKAHLIALFGVGCAANSLISWLAAIHPDGGLFAKGFYGTLLLLLGIGLMLDDTIYPALNLSQYGYYGLLGVTFLSALLGSGLIWLSQ